MNILEFFQGMGFMQMTWQQGIMLLVSFVLLYLAIHKKYEPLMGLSSRAPVCWMCSI